MSVRVRNGGGGDGEMGSGGVGAYSGKSRLFAFNGGEEIGDREIQGWELGRGEAIAIGQYLCLKVAITLQGEYRNGLLLRINDPIFGMLKFSY